MSQTSSQGPARRSALLAAVMIVSLAAYASVAGAAAPNRSANEQSWTITELPFAERNLNQSWAPDSHRIAFGDDEGRISIYDVRTGRTTPLTPPGSGGQPTWTNDGRIMFSLRPEGVGAGAGNAGRTGPPRIFSMRPAPESRIEEIEISEEFPRDVNYWDSTTPAKISTDGRHVSFTIRPPVGSVDMGPGSQGWEVVEGRIVRTATGLRLQDMKRIVPADDYWHETKGYTRDGTLVVGSSRGDGNGNANLNPDVYTYDRASGQLERHTRNPAWEETLDAVGDVMVFNSDRENLSGGQAQLLPRPPGIPDRLFVATSVPITSGGLTSHDLFLAGPGGDQGPVIRLTTAGDWEGGGWAATQPKLSPDATRIRFQQAQGIYDNGQGRVERSMLLTFDRRAVAP